MTQDTLTVAALHKQLVGQYKESKTVRVWKLFARHLSLADQTKALEAEANENTINIYLGTPNRIKQLALAGTINVGSKKFKKIVFDCAKNKKNFTIFETHETRDDTFGLLALAKKPLLKRKLQIILA